MNKETSFRIFPAIVIVALLVFSGYMMINNREELNIQLQPEIITISVTDENGNNISTADSDFIDGKFTFSTTTRLDSENNSKPIALIRDPVKYYGEEYNEKIAFCESTTNSHELNKLQKGGFSYSNEVLVKDGELGNYDSVRISSINIKVREQHPQPGHGLFLDINGIGGHIDAIFREHGLSLIYELKQGEESVLVSKSGDIKDIQLHMSSGSDTDIIGTVVLNAYILYPNTEQQLETLDLSSVVIPGNCETPLSFNVRVG